MEENVDFLQKALLLEGKTIHDLDPEFSASMKIKTQEKNLVEEAPSLNISVKILLVLWNW